MFRYTLIRSGLFICLLLFLQVQTSLAIVFFDGTFQQAVAKAKDEDKKVLIYFTAKWCGPCRYMEKNVFHADSITQITDHHYVAFKVDYDAWNTKPMVEKYRVASLPTFVIINSLEAVEKRALGRLTVSELSQLLAPTTVQTVKRTAFELYSDEKRYTDRRMENARWKLEVGLQAGANLTQVTNLAASHKLSYDLGLLLIWTKHRISIRPGLSLVSIGGKLSDGQSLRLHYVALPVNLSYLLRNTVVLGLPGGYRANLAPYISQLINSPTLPVNSLDYGTKLGLSAFIGETSRLEAQLGYQLGVKDVGWSANSGLYNRGLYLCVTFIL